MRFSNLPLDYFTFQFHKGAIRTDGVVVSRCLDDDFNSIKVRLEHLNAGHSWASYDISIP